MSARPSPCECVRRLREFKNEALFRFQRKMMVPDPGIMGAFGIDVPEEEDVLEAIEELKESLDGYTRDCPFKISPEAAELHEVLETVTAKKATIEDILSGEYGDYYTNVIEKAEIFTQAALEGILSETTGLRFTKGPLGLDPDVAPRCTMLLNNIEALSVEIEDKSEFIENYMDVPPEALDELVELNNAQRAITNEYIWNCKPMKSLADKSSLEAALESWPINRQYNEERLDKYDEWTEEHYPERPRPGDPEMEKWLDRIGGRQKWLRKIKDDVDHHQNPLNVFLEDEWLTACGPLQWKETIIGGGGGPPGMYLQVSDRERPRS